MVRRVWDGKFNLYLHGYKTVEEDTEPGKRITLFNVGSFVFRYDFLDGKFKYVTL
jgi:hypothetical protein